ncbi:HAMP domain-containing histidine kinase [Flavobacterium zepuense]|uniref:histidine kinase n=1 Tax=Flavobacterium zepuense TaxID=2593302 RepID=A0A552V1C8_9FLAO|nr:HAMP domain-containing sensor histidine kinase [Flavobacterium zepuense]TRW24278.1 HAMP domain-containing histidine kinase [Flavobacterium zepuense]
MPKPSIKNRIALYNLAGAATLVLVTFVVIYRIVSASVNYDINADLQIEIDRHTNFVAQQPVFKGLIEDNEWGESEHKEIVINPVFVQIFDNQGRSIDKSPNLKRENLKFLNSTPNKYIDTQVAGIDIRQQMAPLINNGQRKGFVIIAMSVKLPHRVLDNLLTVLLLAYPIVLLILFYITRVIAGRSLAPALTIIATTKKITEGNFDKRIILPAKKDELFILSTAINDLLERIENAITREKQFTSDASHELRTPLAVIKGTLEVLIRKPRQTEEYEEKIRACITEVNRLTDIVEQLLLLARFESNKAVVNLKTVAVDEIILQAMERYSPDIQAKKLNLTFSFKEHFYVVTDAGMASIIVENLLSNAIKYSFNEGHINIGLAEANGKITATIADNGQGIAAADLARVYEQFYRSEAVENTTIKGTGLGLSIVKRLCDLLSIQIAISSEKGRGTTVKLVFNTAQAV